MTITILEAAGIAGGGFVAQTTGRLDALPVWIGLIVGLHFLPLARIFQAPVYYLTGIGITLWCVFSWVLFQGDQRIIYVCFGVGAILWATSSYNLFRALARRSASPSA